MRHLVVCCLASSIWLTSQVSAETNSQQGPDDLPSMADEENVVGAKIDQLLTLQDMTGAGDRNAVAEQKALLVEIGRHLKSLPSDSSPRFISQVAAYVLSGGDPKLAEGLSKVQGLSASHQGLLEASALFMQGDRKAAEKLFDKIDATQLPARLAGRIALAQALLAEKQATQDYLSIAVSAMPGTLIEESALRRSALAFAESREEEPFWRRLERYSRRFPASPYAEAFWNDVMGALAKWSVKGHGPNLQRLDAVLGRIPITQRRRLYLSLARQSAIAGVPELAQFAGRRLQRLALQGSVEDNLANLYVSIYGIVLPDGDAAMQRLSSVRQDMLGPLDAALFEAALALGRQIARPAPELGLDDEGPPEGSALESRGANLMSQSDKLVTELN